MKREFSISLSFHLLLFLTVIFFARVLNLASQPSYPAVYQVNLVSLPQVSGSEGQDMESAPVPEAKPSAQKEPAAPKVKPQPKAKTPDKKPKSAGGPVVPNLPQGMKVLAAEGVSPEGSYYLGMILTKISQHWRNPYQGGKQVIRSTIYFKIDRQGNLLEANLEKSSGDALFDQAAIRAVYQAKTFPPFPQEMKVSVLGVHFEFEYVK
ncbi:MAG: TonB family protein [Candidatus Edwardsbacteria bacterium]|nr:TonB family protein [Candidatus Edwardsbacteria bacterium]MBU2463978.1 TonB family protein [Candidatus Edwardsbacteria bacterium]MBU2593266.1 TonB family protein [Candidatus Edwardsbacteria bacterium]